MSLHLSKGMKRESINEMLKYFNIEILDEIFHGRGEDHACRCLKCGHIFYNKFYTHKNRYFKRVCEVCYRNNLKTTHKSKIEDGDKYTYIDSYFVGDIHPVNHTVIKNNLYAKVTCNYCNYTSIKSVNSIMGKGCRNCCNRYENSFAYHIEQELGEPLDKYWDFEKNDVNPYHIYKGSHRKVWIKCQEKDYHGSYSVNISDFVYDNSRCSYCSNRKTHPYDSFGYHNFDKVMSWHLDNEISPFRVAKNSGKKYKFICPECGHIFSKRIANVNTFGVWCPHCSMSKGENKISDWLRFNDINYIYDKPYFEDLTGIGGGLLRPDFILPEHKIWIEYDGEFHYKDMYKDGSYEILKMHDKLKDKYAKLNNWKLIRIPYWDFFNVEKILKKELKGCG